MVNVIAVELDDFGEIYVYKFPKYAEVIKEVFSVIHPAAPVIASFSVGELVADMHLVNTQSCSTYEEFESKFLTDWNWFHEKKNNSSLVQRFKKEVFGVVD